MGRAGVNGPSSVVSGWGIGLLVSGGSGGGLRWRYDVGKCLPGRGELGVWPFFRGHVY